MQWLKSRVFARQNATQVRTTKQSLRRLLTYISLHFGRFPPPVSSTTKTKHCNRATRVVQQPSKRFAIYTVEYSTPALPLIALNILPCRQFLRQIIAIPVSRQGSIRFHITVVLKAGVYTAMQLQPDVHELWIQHQRRNNKTTQTWACIYCEDRKIFESEDELWKHFLLKHREQLPAEKDGQDALEFFRRNYAAESAKKR